MLFLFPLGSIGEPFPADEKRKEKNTSSFGSEEKVRGVPTMTVDSGSANAQKLRGLETPEHS